VLAHKIDEADETEEHRTLHDAPPGFLKLETSIVADDVGQQTAEEIAEEHGKDGLHLTVQWV
jgi:hypothetical protein